jgi:hypothetical protein
MGATAGEDNTGTWFRLWYLSRDEIERRSLSRWDSVAMWAELRTTDYYFIHNICTRLRDFVGIAKNQITKAIILTFLIIWKYGFRNI